MSRRATRGYCSLCGKRARWPYGFPLFCTMAEAAWYTMSNWDAELGDYCRDCGGVRQDWQPVTEGRPCECAFEEGE
jgi:hypothetical protein